MHDSDLSPLFDWRPPRRRTSAVVGASLTWLAATLAALLIAVLMGQWALWPAAPCVGFLAMGCWLIGRRS